MTIKATKLEDGLYAAEATPPHARSSWKSQPMQLRQLIAELRALGCHPADIGDALYTVDRDWVKRLDG